MKTRDVFRLLSTVLIVCLACSVPSGLYAAGEIIKVVIIGDSTVQTYGPDRDVRGWGQYFDGFFPSDVEIVNLAKSGRSTKTFIEEGLWDGALRENADFILIQFGHNDSHAKERPESTDAATDFRDNLRRYIDEARKNGAEPILITPMHRRLFKDGKPTMELLPYANAMKIVAREKDVLLIDLHALSGTVLARLGDDGSADIYVSPKDRTHFSEKGAKLMAKLVAEELARMSPDLGMRIDTTGEVLRHVVLFSFKESAAPADIEHIEEAFRALPSKIDAIRDFEWGTNVSPENKARGFTHCFFLTFLTEADRDAYLPHPAHKAFGKVLGPHVENVLVIDYWTRK